MPPVSATQSPILIGALALVAAAVMGPGSTAAAQGPPSDVRIDFSHAGYGGGGVPLPDVPAVVAVRPSGGDDTPVIQAALDRVARRLPRAGGSRGAVQLAPGRFLVAGQLHLRASGVVLRGSGAATVVVATGHDRRSLIVIGGTEPPSPGAAVPVADETVPAGSRTLRVERTDSLGVGDRVVVTRPSTGAWIHALGMDTIRGTFAELRLRWPPGSRDLVWDRRLDTIDRATGRITLDAPLTTALERRYGGGTVARVTGGESPRGIGVEALTLESAYDGARPRDEDHAWIAIALDHVEDAWVRSVVARHFAGSAVRVGPRARRVTVVDTRSEQPVSEAAGYRRQSFLVEGQQVLVYRCAADAGMNDFAVGLLAAGPNVFLADTARGALGPSGAFESWASGTLYERVRVEGAGLRLAFDMTRAQGAGWTAANSVVWSSSADTIDARGPAETPNVVRASAGPLYAAQLARRVGARRARTALAPRAAPRMVPGLPALGARDVPRPSPSTPVDQLEIVNGRFVIAGRVVWGGTVNDGWWRGQAVPAIALDHGISLTRFVPGRVGPGLTEDLPRLAARMADEGTPFYQSVPGLWYDRRRDEHSVTARTDANVWAPFYEMPWARTGEGRAWDGLSRFDLTRWNPWYFDRLREFADLAGRHGLVLELNLYNTHNLLEILPHWVDYPWRPANDVNDTGLPEPPPVEPGDRIHVANQVYDVSDPRRAALHRAYILHTLDAVGAADHVILGVSFQFAGPLTFQRFFLDVVREWEERTHRTVRVALTTSKDITDSILADPVRSRQIAVIDTRYWQYRPDGSLWAPRGGRNVAFREAIAADFGASGDTPPATTPEQAYRQVREYRDRFPEKAVVAWNDGVGPIPAFMAGAAQVLMRNPAAGHNQARTVDRTPLDTFVREQLATALPRMTPRDSLVSDSSRTWVLADEAAETVLVYSLAGASITLARPLPGARHEGLWLDPRSGATHPQSFGPLGRGAVVAKPTAGDWLLLLRARPR